MFAKTRDKLSVHVESGVAQTLLHRHSFVHRKPAGHRVSGRTVSTVICVKLYVVTFSYVIVDEDIANESFCMYVNMSVCSRNKFLCIYLSDFLQILAQGYIHQ